MSQYRNGYIPYTRVASRKECDDLMDHMQQLQKESILEAPASYLAETRIVNFSIIRKEIQAEQFKSDSMRRAHEVSIEKERHEAGRIFPSSFNGYTKNQNRTILPTVVRGNYSIGNKLRREPLAYSQ